MTRPEWYMASTCVVCGAPIWAQRVADETAPPDTRRTCGCGTPVPQPEKAAVEGLDVVVQRAILSRSLSGTPLRGQLSQQAREMLAAGWSEGDVALRIEQGETVDV